MGDIVVKISDRNMVLLAMGKVSPQKLIASQDMEVSGNPELALELRKMLGKAVEAIIVKGVMGDDATRSSSKKKKKGKAISTKAAAKDYDVVAKNFSPTAARAGPRPQMSKL